jgi:hypothetical protein
MADEQIHLKPSLTNPQFNDDTKLIAMATPGDGKLFSGTVAQAKEIFGPHVNKYTATGSEGSTLIIAALASKTILLIVRESGPVYEVASSPGSAEFTFDGTNIVFGTPLGAGERFVIIYKYA